jgi:hypothetical protein
MKVLMVNGSPKAAGSSSGMILDQVAAALGPGHEIVVKRAASGVATRADLEAEILVFAFPLYVDALPAPLLEWLIAYRELASARDAALRQRTTVYAICNCGFWESAQTESALRIVRSFARSSSLSWGGGLGIGSGGMIEGLAKAPPEMPIKKPVSAGLQWLSGLVARGETPGELRYVQHAFPRWAYIAMAHLGWRQMARANGLRPRDIRRTVE